MKQESQLILLPLTSWWLMLHSIKNFLSYLPRQMLTFTGYKTLIPLLWYQKNLLARLQPYQLAKLEFFHLTEMSTASLLVVKTVTSTSMKYQFKKVKLLNLLPKSSDNQWSNSYLRFPIYWFRQATTYICSTWMTIKSNFKFLFLVLLLKLPTRMLLDSFLLKTKLLQSRSTWNQREFKSKENL